MNNRSMNLINKVAPKVPDHVKSPAGVRYYQVFNSFTMEWETKSYVTFTTTSASRQRRKQMKRAVRGMSHKQRRDYYRNLGRTA